MPLATAPSMWQPRGPATACRLVSRRHHLCPRSGASSRHYFLLEAIPTASTAHDNPFPSCAAKSVFSFDVVRCPCTCSHFNIRHLNSFFDDDDDDDYDLQTAPKTPQRRLMVFIAVRKMSCQSPPNVFNDRPLSSVWQIWQPVPHCELIQCKTLLAGWCLYCTLGKWCTGNVQLMQTATVDDLGYNKDCGLEKNFPPTRSHVCRLCGLYVDYAYLFSVAGSRLWNSLPPDVTSASTLWLFFATASKLTSFPDHFLPKN